MAGLLGDVLPYVYSRGNALQRMLGGLLNDPAGSASQSMGLLADKSRENQNMLAQAFQDPQRPFKVTDQGALGQAGTNMLTGLLGFAPAGITAWHGSPHIFDKFDSSKIGTGEGAQAYGHGLYLAESPAVAKQYADTLGVVGAVDKGGAQLGRDGVADLFSRRLQEKGLPKSAADSQAGLWADSFISGRPVTHPVAADVIATKGLKTAKEGSLYKVDLPDDAVAKMLDWDKPLSQQAPAVRQTMEALIAKARAKAEASGVRPQYWPPNVQQAQEMSGEMLRKHLADTFPSIGMGRFETSAQQAGIPGIRYLDGQSRGAGGTSNFVVFPGEEKILSILERNGQPLR